MRIQVLKTCLVDWELHTEGEFLEVSPSQALLPLETGRAVVPPEYVDDAIREVRALPEAVAMQRAGKTALLYILER